MAEKKYKKLFLNEPELRHKVPAELAPLFGPCAYIDSERQFGSKANFSMAWRLITKPMFIDRVPHAHPFDEFLCFLGGNLENMFDFDATIELSMGPESELHVIEKATVVYIPAGTIHCPLKYKRIGKPILFHPIALTPAFYSKSANNKLPQ
jgi:mannose-6-phosphate isomerase-like protein (cupin superfamily)